MIAEKSYARGANRSQRVVSRAPRELKGVRLSPIEIDARTCEIVIEEARTRDPKRRGIDNDGAVRAPGVDEYIVRAETAAEVRRGGRDHRRVDSPRVRHEDAVERRGG